MTPRPNLADGRDTAADTYRRRRARRAADELLEIPPELWDDHTTRVVIVTLPSLVYAGVLARYGEPAGQLDALDTDETIFQDAQGFTSCHSGVCGECDACRTTADDPLSAPPVHDNGDYRA
jgi:hypothetical protein